MAKKKLTPEQEYEANKKSLQTLLEKKQVIEDNGGILKPDDSRQMTNLENAIQSYEKELERSKQTIEERNANVFKLNGYDIDKVSRKFKDFAMYMIFCQNHVCFCQDSDYDDTRLVDALEDGDWVNFDEGKRYFVKMRYPVEDGKYTERYYLSVSEENLASTICNSDPWDFGIIEGIFDMDNPIYDKNGFLVECGLRVTGWEIVPPEGR